MRMPGSCLRNLKAAIRVAGESHTYPLGDGEVIVRERREKSEAMNRPFVSMNN